MANQWPPGGLDAIKGDYDYTRLVIITPIRGQLPPSPAHILKGRHKSFIETFWRPLSKGMYGL